MRQIDDTSAVKSAGSRPYRARQMRRHAGEAAAVVLKQVALIVFALLLATVFLACSRYDAFAILEEIGRAHV